LIQLNILREKRGLFFNLAVLPEIFNYFFT